MFESFIHGIFTNVFLQNAALAIILISAISGIIGSLLVSNRIVFVGGGVAHCAYAGIGSAVFYGFSTLLGASLSAVVVALSLAFVKKKFEEYIDTFNAILWAFGMSIGTLFLNLTTNINVDIESYLFGSLISVDTSLLLLMFGFDMILIIFLTMYYREILSISYDYEFCKLKNMRADIITNCIFMLIGIGVILSMQISGLILVLAMLSIPAYMSSLFVRTLKMQIVLSSILSFMFMFVGLFFAYQYNLLPGAIITLVGVISMVIVGVVKYCFYLKG